MNPSLISLSAFEREVRHRIQHSVCAAVGPNGQPLDYVAAADALIAILDSLDPELPEETAGHLKSLLIRARRIARTRVTPEPKTEALRQVSEAVWDAMMKADRLH